MSPDSLDREDQTEEAPSPPSSPRPLQLRAILRLTPTGWGCQSEGSPPPTHRERPAQAADPDSPHLHTAGARRGGGAGGEPGEQGGCSEPPPLAELPGEDVGRVVPTPRTEPGWGLRICDKRSAHVLSNIPVPRSRNIPGKRNFPAATEQTPRSLLLETDVATALEGLSDPLWTLGAGFSGPLDRRATWEGVSCREEAGRQLRKPYPSIWRRSKETLAKIWCQEPNLPPPHCPQGKGRPPSPAIDGRMWSPN